MLTASSFLNRAAATPVTAAAPSPREVRDAVQKALTLPSSKAKHLGNSVVFEDKSKVKVSYYKNGLNYFTITFEGNEAGLKNVVKIVKPIVQKVAKESGYKFCGTAKVPTAALKNPFIHFNVKSYQITIAITAGF